MQIGRDDKQLGDITRQLYFGKAKKEDLFRLSSLKYDVISFL